MESSAKYYKKALEMCQVGEINKSMVFCEKSISSNLHNTSAINLKGLLYYLKGDIKNAKALWLMNRQENRNAVSGKYLENLKKDEERLTLYHAALRHLEELEVNDALKLLEKCSESDFNIINVNNYKSLCYIKKGEYDKAKECIDTVLEFDRHDKTALQYNKILIDYGIIEKKKDYKPYIIAAVCVVLAVLVFISGRAIMNSRKASISKPVVNHQAAAKKSEKKNSKEQNNVVTAQKVQQDVFPYNEISSYISSNNYDSLYSDVMEWENKSLQTNEKALMDQAVSVLEDSGLNYMYNTALNYRNNGDYKNAMNYFVKAYNFSSESYLNEHILYMLGAVSESLGDTDNQLKYYTEYLSKFPEGTYASTVNYEMAMYYMGKNNSQAVPYAQKIRDSYYDSIYNNDNISAILQQN